MSRLIIKVALAILCCSSSILGESVKCKVDGVYWGMPKNQLLNILGSPDKVYSQVKYGIRGQRADILVFDSNVVALLKDQVWTVSGQSLTLPDGNTIVLGVNRQEVFTRMSHYGKPVFNSSGNSEYLTWYLEDGTEITVRLDNRLVGELSLGLNV